MPEGQDEHDTGSQDRRTCHAATFAGGNAYWASTATVCLCSRHDNDNRSSGLRTADHAITGTVADGRMRPIG
ncbi:hypothetical protein ACFTY7_16860 [Streptomyces sp. NPDC057062]|uniref:hypothetical protein n=1 Tax=Streptomyces sp. NPDC057062 TaxID=3346011 RepID=UPI003633DD88